jgi:3,5-epimerase/4-reductase
MKNRILILGAGFIGSRLQEALQCKISSRRISTVKDAEDEIERERPEILINCIGDTGMNNVDDCENDRDRALLANTCIPIMLAEASLRFGIRLIHISSGCIYHFEYGRPPIAEEERPDFFDLFYSRSKIYAERALEPLTERYDILIPRIRIPLDDIPHPRNLLTKLINYGRVIDIPNSITYIPDFIQALQHLIGIKARGIYNVVNAGALRYPELMDIYRKFVPEYQYETIDYSQLHLTRTNLLLSTEKLEKTGFATRDIHDVLEGSVQAYLKNADRLNI